MKKRNDRDLHGGNIYLVARELNLKEKDIVDFSSNINPLGPSGNLKRAITRNLDSIQRYPDPRYERLRSAVADYHALPAEQVTAGNGATEIIYLLARTLRPARALIAAPAFSEYQRALSLARCQVNYFRLSEKDDFVLDVEKLAREVNKGYDLLVLCNPNNPTGGYIPPEKIEKICAHAERKGVRVMLDESFIEFVRVHNETETAARVKRFKNLFVIRSMTKFFAMPGLRLGYSLCRDRVINERMLSLKEPWTVNALAEAAACAVLPDQKYREKTVGLVEAERRYLQRSLADLPWLAVYPSEVNFLLARINGGGTAADLKDALLKKNILIRDASNFRFLDSTFFRIAVRVRSDNRRLVDVLGKLQGEPNAP